MKTKSRKEVKESLSNQLIHILVEENKYSIGEVIDNAYCDGYNTVLEAAEECLSVSDYAKLVEYLNNEGK